MVILHNHSINYGLELIDKVYRDGDNDDSMHNDIDIPELIVRSRHSSDTSNIQIQLLEFR